MISRRDLLRAGAASVVVGAGAGATGVTAGAAVRSRTDWERLRRSLRGEVVFPADSGYDLARQSGFQQFDHLRPRAVAFCETTGDVQAVVRFARDHDLPTAVRSGGHSFGGYSSTDGLLLDVSRLDQVTFGATTATVGPGLQQVDALAAAPPGVALVGGLCPTVCAGGFLQGGGIGWATRRFGMAADRVAAAEVVLADGKVVRASRHEHPDLFWALRGGGGGNFGVVTRYAVRPVPVTGMTNYNLTWPADSAAQVLAAWQHWILDGDRDLGSEVALVWPDAGTGAPQLTVYGGHFGTRAALDRALAALEDAVGSPPATRDVQELSYRDAMMQWYGCADLTVDECHRVGYLPDAQIPRQVFFLDRNRFASRALPADGLDRLLATFTANPRAGQFRVLALFAAGGAANDPGRTDTAYVHRTSQILVHHATGLNDPAAPEADKAAAAAWVDDAFAAAEPCTNGESYQNFIDPRLPDWRSAYYAENYGRLVAVRRTYDPDRFFRSAQAID